MDTMVKKIIYTKITPLPNNVPRELAVELLHAHEEVAKLNPLVTGVKTIDAPRDCPNEEYFSQWYEISEIITWGFGMKKRISFKGVFHDQPWGMQSHIYAPMGVDLRNKYRIGGNQPGEPREPRELGVDTPREGLYLRQDVEIRCNLALASFVKKETQEATGKMIERLAKKAELLDEGKLHAMWDNGRLKTAKPSEFLDDDASTYDGHPGRTSHSLSPPTSPSMSANGHPLPSPRMDQRGYSKYHDISRSSSQLRKSTYTPAYQQQGYTGPEYLRPHPSPQMPMINELPGDYYQYGLTPQPLKPQGPVFRSELPGDTTFGAAPPPPPPSEKKQHYQAYLPPEGPHPTQRNSHPNLAYPPAPADPHAQRPHSSSYSGPLSNPWPSATAPAPADPDQPPSLPPRSTARRSLSSQRDSVHSPPDRRRSSQWSARSGTHSTQDLSPPPPPQPQHPRPSLYQGGNATAGSVSGTSQCPVCRLFEGDEQAVSHHVTKAHFS